MDPEPQPVRRPSFSRRWRLVLLAGLLSSIGLGVGFWTFLRPGVDVTFANRTTIPLDDVRVTLNDGDRVEIGRLEPGATTSGRMPSSGREGDALHVEFASYSAAPAEGTVGSTYLVLEPGRVLIELVLAEESKDMRSFKLRMTYRARPGPKSIFAALSRGRNPFASEEDSFETLIVASRSQANPAD